MRRPRSGRSSRARFGRLLVAGALLLAIDGCTRTPREPPMFELLAPDATGVHFTNALPESADFNILNYLYYYDGGGVAVGDVNNDGLPDLYFTSNIGPNRLYLNRGGYKFEDVTARAGVADADGWKTGVTMADVNGDGWLDIYVSGVNYLTMHGKNVLYINNGDGTFTDRTAAYGLDHVGYSTQATFFDYDGDGDLDMFLISHSTHTERANGSAMKRDVQSAVGGGRLFRNDGGHFTDVSAQAGIYGGIEGFGLGVVASDLDGDGCIDVYVANDFQEEDFLYHNNCDGTFTESIATATKHVSRSSMGVDAADVDNDGRPDIVVADMLPERQDVLQTSATSESYSLFNARIRAGYHPQYGRNTLQLNRGGGRFSEIGLLAGIAATDWSWAPLFADLDNDGRKDLFITSGIYRRPNDLDYLALVGSESVQASLAGGITNESLALLKQMPQVPVPNHAFHNDGGLAFTDRADAWGLGRPGFSNGAVYADLNNSGALDLVVSNINAPASIYRNHARERNGNAYLTIVLKGDGANTSGIGAKVIVRQHGATQLLEQMPTRGFQSSVDPRLHFGLGRAATIDSLIVVWPDRRVQVLTGVGVNRTITLSQRDAAIRVAPPRQRAIDPLLTDVTDRVNLDFKHAENPFDDYEREPLIPHSLSSEGPALAVADVNGDGLDDIYVGGAKWQSGRLFLQQRDGSFKGSDQPAISADSLAEDVGAAFFDANGDGWPDLYVASGGNEFRDAADPLRARLYLNDGHGHFSRAIGALPDIFENGSCVVPGDFDGDGDVDLFVGSRAVTGKYGVSPKSHLLENDGHGHFTDVTAERAPALLEAGMVSSAAWIDYDGDGKLDLVVVGEWTPVRVFHQENGRFVERTAAAGFAGTEGWWNSVAAADLNGDGRPDLVLGNLGLNSYIKASPSEPARLYLGDFRHDGTLEQIVTSYHNGVSYPLATRDELLRRMPALRDKYPTYKSFGASRIDDIFPASDLTRARVLEARTFASSIALNTGKGGFVMHALPVEAQFAPVYAIVAADFDGDGRTDLLLGGNFYNEPPLLGRYDASYGTLLRGTGDGRFTAMDMDSVGAAIDGQARAMQRVRAADGGQLIVVARNDDRLQLLRTQRSRPRALTSRH